ncbi:Expansin-B7 [Triticum urartu]|uniref:Expansin-B7 n=1 Tax=Triticum urartu TaxID=4572 RepID=M7YFF1_TRIUA|nr:Expansin-B7 [Triticum urartu]
MTSCGNEPLFKDGKGCGSCYQIRCVGKTHPACSGVPETVIITDMNYYPVPRYHFDLSGTAFGAMAKDGRNDELRHTGIIDMQFKRVPCQYTGMSLTFHVEKGSNPNYLAILVEYGNGDGDVAQEDADAAVVGGWEEDCGMNDSGGGRSSARTVEGLTLPCKSPAAAARRIWPPRCASESTALRRWRAVLSSEKVISAAVDFPSYPLMDT